MKSVERQLADDIVALKVCIARPMSWHLLDKEGSLIAVFTSEKHLVNDWRVAGALMERWGNGIQCVLIVNEWEVSYTYEESSFRQNIIVTNESLPRAIIETCTRLLLL